MAGNNLLIKFHNYFFIIYRFLIDGNTGNENRSNNMSSYCHFRFTKYNNNNNNNNHFSAVVRGNLSL